MGQLQLQDWAFNFFQFLPTLFLPSSSIFRRKNFTSNLSFSFFYVNIFIFLVLLNYKKILILPFVSKIPVSFQKF